MTTSRTKRNAKRVTQSFFIALVIMLLFNIFLKITYVSGDSMLPTYKEGDVLLSRKWGQPKRGEVVTACISGHEYAVVKRVVALEGDSILASNGELYVNGDKVCTELNSSCNEQEIKVPQGKYFLMGDNYEHSLDSSNFGLISRKDIQGIILKKLY